MVGTSVVCWKNSGAGQRGGVKRRGRHLRGGRPDGGGLCRAGRGKVGRGHVVGTVYVLGARGENKFTSEQTAAGMEGRAQVRKMVQ